MTPRRPTLRETLCAALLLLQLAAIARSRTVASRYFCWAPFDTQTAYDLTLTMPGGAVLPREAACARYHILDCGHDNRSPQHVIDIVRQYEETLGRADGARVVMRYTVNGARADEWRWPAR